MWGGVEHSGLDTYPASFCEKVANFSAQAEGVLHRLIRNTESADLGLGDFSIAQVLWLNIPDLACHVGFSIRLRREGDNRRQENQ
jgi:hypothetical protein